MESWWAIAKSTFGRVMRIKSVYLLMALCIVLMSIGTLYNILTIHQEVRLTINASLAITAGISMLIAVFIGAREVTQEIESRTLDTLLAKPIGRDAFIIGKFVGTFMIASVFAIVLGIGLVCVLSFNSVAAPPVIFQAIYLVIIEALVLSAVSILFSILFPEVIGLVFSIIILAVGHLLYVIPILAEASNAKILYVFYYLLPNLDYFNIRGEVARGEDVGGKFLLYATAYGVAYALFVVLLATSCFRKKDIN